MFLYSSVLKHREFLELLEKRYPEKFKELGRPKTFTKYPFLSPKIVTHLVPNYVLNEYGHFMSCKSWRDLNEMRLDEIYNIRQVLHLYSFIFFILGWVLS